MVLIELSSLENQIAQAKASISTLNSFISTAQKEIKSFDEILGFNFGGTGRKIEVTNAGLKKQSDARNRINILNSQIQSHKKNIADLQKFISLESEQKRSQDISTGLLAARDLDAFSSREKQELSAESRRIMAAFEESKKGTLNSGDAQKRADMLAAEQKKAEDVLFNILNPAIVERNRKEKEARDIQANLDIFTNREKEESERLRKLDEQRLRDLQNRFDNLPLDQFIDKINAERAPAIAAAELAAEDALNLNALEKIDAAKDKNKAIKDTLDNFLAESFNFLIPKETPKGEPGIREIAEALKNQNDVQIDDLVEAAIMQKAAGEEVKAMLEAGLI